MTMTSHALGMLGVLSLLSVAACQDQPSPAPSQSFTSPNAAPIPGDVEAVGQDAESIYLWSNDGFMRRIDKATMTVTAQTSVAVPFVNGIAVDATDIYFTVLLLDHGEVWRLPKSGGSPVPFATGFKQPMGIALDGNTIYVVDIGTFQVGAPGNDGVIRAFPKAGGPAVVLAQGEQLPWSIALDATSVVWASTVWGSTNGSIRRVAKSGGPVATLAAGIDPGTISIVGSSVFWQGGAGIQTVPLTGGDVRTVTTDDAMGGQGAFAADATGAYYGKWGADQEGAVFYVPLAGGTPSTMAPPSTEAADALSGATTFTLVDGCRLYAVEYDATYSQGASSILHRLAKIGTAPPANASRANLTDDCSNTLPDHLGNDQAR